MPGFLLNNDFFPHFFTFPDQPVCLIGRCPEADIFLPDIHVSRRHVICRKRGIEYWLENRSQNGSRLNGQALKRAQIIPGDTLEIGPYTLTWLLEEPNSDRPHPQATLAVTNERLIGQSTEFKKCLQLCRRYGHHNLPVLILGETGTGKDLIANYIFQHSQRADQAFIAINCAELSPQLVESEIFGHERGAFTGSQQQRKGIFEEYNFGTIFLDEIGEFPLHLQPKLLRILEQQRIRRLGSNKEINLDVRLIAATHRHLKDEVKNQRFREDLFHRLHVLTVRVPSLRERKEDIPLLANHFLTEIGPGLFLDETGLNQLIEYHWPGNIRELKNIMYRAAVTHDPGSSLPVQIPELHEPKMLAEIKPENEKEFIMETLRKNRWHRNRTAKALGMSRTTLFHKMKSYGL